MNIKLKYIFKVLFEPSCWRRPGKTDPEWDKILWNNLIEGKINHAGRYKAIIDDTVVWIENYPYASGSRDGSRDLCTRSTALFLNDEIKKIRIIQKLRGIDFQEGFKYKDGIIV